MNNYLHAELLAMAEQELSVRTELLAGDELFDGYHPRMAAVHENNAESLLAIVDRYGWPGRSLVGDEGAEAAWLVLQHSIAFPDLQRKCLPLLEAASQSGEVPAAYVAYLEDRISVFEGRPQRYGTQLDWDSNGELSPYPLEEPERVNAYRKLVGLAPLAEQITKVGSRAAAEGEQPPVDFHKRQLEKELWAKKAGWR